MADFKIRFVSESNFGSGVVEFFEGGSHWSHTEIVLPDGKYLGARRVGGVAIRNSDYITNINHERRYSIPVTDDAYTKIMDFAMSQIGKKYDISLILGIAFHKNWHNKNEWDCSEYVTSSAIQGDLYFLNVEPNYTYKVTPETLHLSPILMGHCYYSYARQ